MPASPTERGAWPAMAGVLILMAVHVAGKAVRDTLFLSNFEVTDLPKMMIAASLAALLAAIGVSRFLSRFNPAYTVPFLMLFSGALIFVEWILVLRVPRVGAVAVYLHMASLALVLFSGFWSVVNERFDPYTAKTIVARASGFGALGGVLGGLAAMQLAPQIGIASLLPGFALLHLVGAGAIYQLGRPMRRTRKNLDTDSTNQTEQVGFIRNPLILRMALLLALVQGIEQLIDYTFKATAAETFAEQVALVRFFAVFYTASSLLAFALQTGFGSRTLKRLGVGGTLMLLPAAVGLTSGGAAMFQSLWTVTLARATNSVMVSSFFKSGFELLWTPVPNRQKRRAKVFVDVGASGVGDLAGSGLVLVLVSWMMGVPPWVLMALAGVLSLCALYLVFQLHHGYIRQLAANLRSGDVSLEETDVQDPTTAQAVAESHVTLDRAELMARIRELDLSGRTEVGAANPDQESDPGELQAGTATAHLAEAVGELESAQPDRVRTALALHSGRVELTPHVLALLARPAVASDALTFLRELAPRILGQLVDTLGDPEVEVLVRRRIPDILAAAPGRRTLAGLTLGLEDPDFDVQFESLRASLRVAEAGQLKASRREMLALVERTLELNDRTWEQRGRRRRDASDESALLEPRDLNRIDRMLEFVFTALATIYGRDVMASTLRALHSDDLTLRGTALEYLETILAERVRVKLFARIPGGSTARVTRRQGDELAEALLRSSAAPTQRKDKS